MSKGFNMLNLLNNKSKEGIEINTKDFKRIKLDPNEVIPSQSNFYSQDNIEELADTFLLVGQQQPTVLGKVNGEYRIISGHRRNLANILNIDRGYKEYEEVEYLYKEMTESIFELSLLIGNAFTRKLTPYEEAEQALRLKNALIRARDEDGLEVKGKLRNIIAELLNTSSTQIARMESINNNLTIEAKEQFKNGQLSITAAYETSKLPGEKQKEIAEKAAKGEEIKPKDITTIIQETRKEKVSISDTSPKQEDTSPQHSDLRLLAIPASCRRVANLVVIDDKVVNTETGEVVHQVPKFVSKKIIDRIKSMGIDELADFICSKCGGGGGCAGFCDLAIICTNENKHKTCVKWLNTQI